MPDTETGLRMTVTSDDDGFVLIKEGDEVAVRLTPSQAMTNGLGMINWHINKSRRGEMASRMERLAVMLCADQSVRLGTGLINESEMVCRRVLSNIGRRG